MTSFALFLLVLLFKLTDSFNLLVQEFMVLRHHNEAESLHAVQRMDWEWKLKELGDCDANSRPHIDDLHVPMVHVSDDFDLLPE